MAYIQIHVQNIGSRLLIELPETHDHFWISPQSHSNPDVCLTLDTPQTETANCELISLVIASVCWRA